MTLSVQYIIQLQDPIFSDASTCEIAQHKPFSGTTNNLFSASFGNCKQC